MKKYALISVSDKTNIVDFASRISDKGYEILATGNTAKVIKETGLDCIEVQSLTSFPEIFSGRVKTLHPVVMGGILMRRDNRDDLMEAEANGINPIEIVCVNLYPFPSIASDNNIQLDTKIENIDIGGPSLIRAAAKNYKFVSVITNPKQYDSFLEKLESNEIDETLRRKLAAEAFAYTSAYDTIIADFFEKEFKIVPSAVRLNCKIQSSLRYGENPHQEAKLCGNFFDYFDIIHGKELSYNNIVDLSAAVDLISDLGPHSCAIIKHTNPCGAASAADALEAYEKALSGDPVSAYGGIVIFNDNVDIKTAEKLNDIFLEIICAPGYSNQALDLLKKKKNRRLIILKQPPDKNEIIIKNVPGGLIIQNKDNSLLDTDTIKLVTKRKYSDNELKDLIFAWAICKHTKSNAIVFVKDKKILGVGAGQTSRVDSARVAVMKAKEHGHNLLGAVAASDAYFPFADGLIEIAEQGITAVVQPGGSIRDSEVIQAADDKNISMIFTGTRNFKH